MTASMANLRDGFPKAVGNSVTNTSELEIPEREAANPRGDPSYIRSSDRARVRNFLNAIIRRPTFDLGISTPSNADIIDPNYVAEEPCFRPLLLATVLLRMIHNADWGFLLPMIPGDRALMSRRLPTSDSARVDILTNHTFDGRVVGVTYPITPPSFSGRQGNWGVRVTAPYATSHPEEWLVNFENTLPSETLPYSCAQGGFRPRIGHRCVPRHVACDLIFELPRATSSDATCARSSPGLPRPNPTGWLSMQ